MAMETINPHIQPTFLGLTTGEVGRRIAQGVEQKGFEHVQRTEGQNTKTQGFFEGVNKLKTAFEELQAQGYGPDDINLAISEAYEEMKDPYALKQVYAQKPITDDRECAPVISGSETLGKNLNPYYC